MLNNKVILQIVPALNNGGVERGVIETSKFLVKNNNKSIVISSGGVYEHLISRHGGILYKLDVHLKNPLKWKKLRIKVEEIIKKEKVDFKEIFNFDNFIFFSQFEIIFNSSYICSFRSNYC